MAATKDCGGKLLIHTKLGYTPRPAISNAKAHQVVILGMNALPPPPEDLPEGRCLTHSLCFAIQVFMPDKTW